MRVNDPPGLITSVSSNYWIKPKVITVDYPEAAIRVDSSEKRLVTKP